MNRRLLPLHIAVFLQGFFLWVPIEKLFMNEISFTAATIGVMAAAYAAVVPLVEIPSGILADRWSRRGVLVVSSIASLAAALLGGLSNGVAAYVLAMLAVGVYFAMFTGTLDAIVYDTVLEETGDSERFEKVLGRVRFIESVALVSSALLGGWLAELTSTRLMYFLTIPFMAASIVAYLRFREPVLHKTEVRTPLRHHLKVTYGTLTRRARLLPIVALALLTTMLLQTIFEFGPLWMVALAVPAALYGPYWAGLMTTLGLGGLLVGWLRLHRPVPLLTAVGLMILSTLVLTATTSVAVVIVAQIILALLLVGASIVVTKRLHDAVPSTVRTGVASGVSALSWMAFVPFSLVFGAVSNDSGVHDAGWLVVGGTILAGALLLVVVLRRGRVPEPELGAPEPVPALAPAG